MSTDKSLPTRLILAGSLLNWFCRLLSDTNVFEKELGRTLSPLEYDIIGTWLTSGIKEEIIEEALKEAVFNGVNSFKYIDKILFEWNKKGIKKKEDVKKAEKKKEEEKEETSSFDFEWLGE